MVREADLILSNGAEVNFKVTKDEQGNPVVSRLEIYFSTSQRIPVGGIGADTLREIQINKLLKIWLQESRQSYLSKKQEGSLLRYLKQPPASYGRSGLPEIYYASISYFYILQYEKSPGNPKAALAELLNVSPKTLSTRLTQARKHGYLANSTQSQTTSRAGGQLTALCKKIIADYLENM